MDRLLSLWNVKVHEVRLENKTKKKNRENSAGFLPHQHNLSLQKMSFVHEQVSDMQTSTLSGNKYTRKRQKELVGRSEQPLIKRDTGNLDRGYTETFYSMMICVCHQQHGHTDIVGQGHFYQAFAQKSELLLIDRTSSLGCIIELSLVTKTGGFFFCCCCWSLLAVKRLFYQTSSSFDTA